MPELTQASFELVSVATANERHDLAEADLLLLACGVDTDCPELSRFDCKSLSLFQKSFMSDI